MHFEHLCKPLVARYAPGGRLPKDIRTTNRMPASAAQRPHCLAVVAPFVRASGGAMVVPMPRSSRVAMRFPSGWGSPAKRPKVRPLKSAFVLCGNGGQRPRRAVLRRTSVAIFANSDHLLSLGFELIHSPLRERSENVVRYKVKCVISGPWACPWTCNTSLRRCPGWFCRRVGTRSVQQLPSGDRPPAGHNPYA